MKLTFLNAFIICFIFIHIKCISGVEENENLPGEKISLSVPQLSEEENQSQHMPKHLRCDACLAVVHQIYTAFSKAQEKMSAFKESDMIDILEDTCSNAFHEYGVKQVNGINRLSGPGLETTNVMGMTQMGGRWPHRLQEMCHYYIGEAGEFDIYDAFSKDSGDFETCKLGESLISGFFIKCNQHLGNGNKNAKWLSPQIALLLGLTINMPECPTKWHGSPQTEKYLFLQ